MGAHPDKDPLVRASKFLSLVLRHKPEVVGVVLDAQGWVAVDELLEKCRVVGRPITRDQLDTIVATNPKRRFAVSDDGKRIRASQGHSVEVDLGYEPAEPPQILYHGTTVEATHAICGDSQGIKRMSRQHVHLSADRATAENVGGRRGKAAVLVVQALTMHHDGHAFYRSANGVWLTEHVPAEYIIAVEE